jgi:PAS domain S-box-containing protein
MARNHLDTYNSPETPWDSNTADPGPRLGTVVGGIATKIAVAERPRDDRSEDSETELRQLRERLALALEAERLAHFASWDWDLRKDVAVWSDEMYALFGRGPSFVPTYETSMDSMHPEDRARVDASVRKAIADGTPYDIEYRIVRPDGTVRFVRGVGQAHYDAAGNPIRMVGACIDITERRELTRRLVESERQASLGQVASFVAHEVNNPLSNISLLTSSLRKLVKDPDALGKLDKIEAQWRVASRIIRELLETSHAKDVNRSPVDLRSVVEDAAEQVASLRRPEVSLDLDPGLAPVLASVDLVRMTQAIANLIKNALQATERGSVRVRLEDRGADVAIRVSDTGPGIPPEVREKLFRTFFSTKPRGEGTGLGLFFTGFVVTAHGGRIDVESEPGRGSTFTVLVPRGEGEGAVGPTPRRA